MEMTTPCKIKTKRGRKITARGMERRKRQERKEVNKEKGRMDGWMNGWKV